MLHLCEDEDVQTASRAMSNLVWMFASCAAERDTGALYRTNERKSNDIRPSKDRLTDVVLSLCRLPGAHNRADLSTLSIPRVEVRELEYKSFNSYHYRVLLQNSHSAF
jgi:hypothetical protein